MIGESWQAGLSRRGLLAAGSAAALGMMVVGYELRDPPILSVLSAVGSPWLFGEFTPHSTAVDFDEAGMVRVSLPHCVVPLSWRDFVPSEWERLWVYRRHFDWAPTDPPGRVFLDFGSVLTSASVYLNGRRIGGHLGGYLPFHIELTGRLRPRDNVLAVVVDSRWREDVPPNRPKARRPTSIDFYQPGGIPRAVRLRREPRAFLSNVHATASDVLTGAPRLRVVARIDAEEDVPGPVLLDVTLADGATELCQRSETLVSAKQGTTDTALTLTVPNTITLWDTDDPKLYQVHTTLTVGGMSVNSRQTTIGFREARFRRDGFFLNGRRRKLFGLNRHELYPYVGAAMPDRVHRRDAEILKRELNCNMVRCSHYPQSEAFLDACDELGLMVWEEAPGWDYIGDTAWRYRVLQDVHDMIVRDRNHPSIVIWGTRLNETRDNLWLYSRTDDIAERLDSSRPTTGAVNRAPNEIGPVRKSRRGKEIDPYSTTKFTQDVFAYNDYSRPRDPDGAPSLRPPRIDLPYMVSEAVGTIVGPRYYRRTDSEHIQAAQAFLHAAVHNDVASDDRYCGLLGWCAFDYPSGWYHSRDGVKWAGVHDIFREPKLGAAFYRSQVDPRQRPVIEPAFYWDFGPRSPRHGPGRHALIFSNCEQLVLIVDGRRGNILRPDRSLLPHLTYPPFVADLSIGRSHPTELRIDGYFGGKNILSRQFSADTTADRLAVRCDDDTLVADGVDATRVSLRVTDRHGAPRPYATGDVDIDVRGAGTLIGNNPFPFTPTGGVGAVWIRTVAGRQGAITVTANHAKLGAGTVVIASVLG